MNQPRKASFQSVFQGHMATVVDLGEDGALAYTDIPNKGYCVYVIKDDTGARQWVTIAELTDQLKQAILPNIGHPDVHNGFRESFQQLGDSYQTTDLPTAMNKTEINDLVTASMAEDRRRDAETVKTIQHWPYCQTCKAPFAFEPEEPFAYCQCGTTEWGYPRPETYVERPGFQQRASEWAAHCFGPETITPAELPERSARFFEESVELVQAAGFPKESAQVLLDHVYSRPVGDPAQEVGGVAVSFSAIATALGVDIPRAAEEELRSIWARADSIRERRKLKPL